MPIKLSSGLLAVAFGIIAHVVIVFPVQLGADGSMNRRELRQTSHLPDAERGTGLPAAAGFSVTAP
ncbi:hypothetical protein ACFQ3C_08490 [Seohaeicola saemankumensis]|uniref:Energy transducer TonB n=1 Tax=Seohaeicola saemankumensis TaxID=481181 RepID=A0ABW3TCD3_9RHOB